MPYQGYAQIVTEPLDLGANAGYVPNGVEGLFHPREQRDDGPEQEGNAEGAQNGKVEIAYIGQDVEPISAPFSPSGSNDCMSMGSSWFWTPKPLSMKKVTARKGTRESSVV